VLIAHCSDLHLLSLAGARVCDFLGKRLTGGANLLLNRGGQFPIEVARALVADVNAQAPGHVVISGDLTNLALAGEFALVSSVIARLELPPAEITIVPGNHDYYSRSAAREDHFARVLHPYLHSDLQPGPGRFPFARLRDGQAGIALCTAHPSAPLLAIGTLGARQRRQAEQLLAAEACRERFRLLVLHHAPLPSHVRWHNRLTDAAELRELLARAGAELVVHGHLHRPLRQGTPGPAGEIPVVGVGSSTWISPHAEERRAQYNLYEVEGRRLARVRTRRYDLDGKRFVELAPCSL
jgi:3',5'-cyclic AMP phosphodiesterase CpdA